MKKLFILMIVPIAATIFSCSKEKVNLQENPSISKSAITEVSSENGVLKFKDEKAFRETIKNLQPKNLNEIADWEKSLNFKSQFSMFNKIIESENLHEAECIKTNNLTEEHSKEYLDAVNSGFLKIIENNGEKSYNYNLYDGSVVNAINEFGLVIIGNDLYQYKANVRKVIAYNGTESINKIKTSTATTSEVKITEFNQNVRGGYNWSNSTGTLNFGNRKRVTMNITGYSTGEGTGAQTVVYNVNVVVEKKNIWGNWKYGDFVCCNLNTSWQYKFGLAKNSTPFLCDRYYSLSLESTPVNNSYPTTYWPQINNLIVDLTPNGFMTTAGTGYDTFCDAFNVISYSFSGNVCGSNTFQLYK